MLSVLWNERFLRLTLDCHGLKLKILWQIRLRSFSTAQQ